MTDFRQSLPWLVLLLTLAAYPSTARAQDAPNPVAEVVKAGTNCRQSTAPLDVELALRSRRPRLLCDYAVGESLHFSILAVGRDDVTITIYRADVNGDYYLSIGGLHDCIVVKQGKKLEERQSSAIAMMTFAFVSPTNGKVYSDWPSCKRAA